MTQPPYTEARVHELETQLEAASRRLEVALTPESMDALGDGWAAFAKSRRLEVEETAAQLGQARSETQEGGGRILALSHVWDDLDGEQQAEALRWAFERVVVHRTPPREEPNLEFVVKAIRPIRLELRPADITPTDWQVPHE